MDIERARKAMVDSQVRPSDVTDIRLLKAMGSLPRETFVPANRRGLAYVEKDIPLFADRWLLKPRDFAKLVHSASLRSEDLVLDIACGYGYSCAVMAHLAGVVIGLEVDEEIAAKASERCADLGLDTVAFMTGTLDEGCPKQGPYDAIIVEGGVEKVPDALLSQLKDDGGRMAIILVEDGVGHATLFTKSGGAIGSWRLFETTPPGILPGFNHSAGFVF